MCINSIFLFALVEIEKYIFFTMNESGIFLSLNMLQVSDTETRLECLLNNNKNSDFCAPLTSFDWNEVDPNLLGKKYYNFKNNQSL